MIRAWRPPTVFFASLVLVVAYSGSATVGWSASGSQSEGSQGQEDDVVAGWNAYRGGPSRAGLTAANLPEELSEQWHFQALLPPAPAWPRSDRMLFDRAPQPIVTQDKCIFGSSSDDAVYALDIDRGTTAWVFRTDGPVRFAPVAWRDRVFVASDDGFLYALKTATGELLWRHRGGPDGCSVLGNGRIISKWPARGGPVVADDTVYFAAGIWPSDGVFIYALDAASGAVRWVNDTAGGLYMPQPHPTAEAKSGVSAQGYLVVAGNHLLVPTGRAVPASFDRQTGRFEYFQLQKYGHHGGAAAMATGTLVLNSGNAFHVDTGDRVASVGAGQLAATDGGLVRATERKLEAYAWEEKQRPDRKGRMVDVMALRTLWSLDGVPEATAVIVAGERVIVGGASKVVMVDRAEHQVAWSVDVDGQVYGLAAAAGKLLVSTDTGSIYCFAVGKAPPQETSTLIQTATVGGDVAAVYAEAAEEIIRRSGTAAGYCVDLGCGDGSLAVALARASRLRIVALDDDPTVVARARARIVAAGLYGTRVTVHCRPLEATGYPRYFANLVVSARSVTQGATALPAAEAGRLQRPCGGAICIGRPEAMHVAFRGPLPGAGSWTHQYADAAHTLISGDQRVKGRLSMLWFRDLDFQLPSRHGRAPAPLSADGRLFHEGMDGVVAVDAYNGRELWRYAVPGLLKAYDGDELMGVAGTGGNMCIGGDSLYLRNADRCLRLDVATGQTLGQFQLPADSGDPPGTWGTLAYDGGILYGSRANSDHVVTYRYINRGGDMSQLLTESRDLFALDATTGDLLWKYTARDSIRHNAIAIGGGTVCFIDRPLALFDRVKRPKEKDHPRGQLVALDGLTGKTLWTVDEEIYGTMLALSAPQGVLLMSYQPTRFRLDSELGGRMSAYDLGSGKRLWSVAANYSSRPMLNGRTIYAQGGAWDLLSGQSRPFKFERSYACGILAGCRNMLLFRSATLGYRDLSPNGSTQNYGGMRPGCWVNTLPAGGLVLIPDASAGCQCSYLNRAWIALEPEPTGPRDATVAR
jgi:outer membrane protein assembly factor BamB